MRWSRRRFITTGLGIGVGALSLGTVGYWLGIGRGGSSATASPGSASALGLAPGAAIGAPETGSPQASGSPAPAPRHSYRSRPDLTPPVISVAQPAAVDVAPGYVFFTPNNGKSPDGPMITDNTGDLVWLRPDSGTDYATNFHPSTYRGQPVLTWWEGTNNAGLGAGEYVIADTSYRQIARVRAGNGLKGDLHEFMITPRDTALFLAGGQAPAADASLATPPPWQIWDFAVQEMDIETGAILFDWHTRDHIDIAESLLAPPTSSNGVYDYVHANSIEIDRDGNFIVSARNTSTVYKVDRNTGAIRWRLGGRRSDFTIGAGVAFAWQHDARRQADGTLTIFDDESAPGESRAIVLNVDETAMTATLEREYRHPQPILATSQGNAQVLRNGDLFVGWGSAGAFSEFRRDGSLAFDASFPSGQSYRCFRFPWTGSPVEQPALAVETDGTLAVAAYCSWNGATEVSSWEILGGSHPEGMVTVGEAARSGFETRMVVGDRGPYFAALARGASGRVLGASSVVRLAG